MFIIDHNLEDFSFTLINSIKYKNWYNGSKLYNYKLVKSFSAEKFFPSNIPVGSIEFVSNYVKRYYNKEILPIRIDNLPKEILNRKLSINSEEVKNLNKIFIKRFDKFKEDIEIIVNKHLNNFKGNFYYSEVIDIESEYRIFVFNNKIVGIKHYLGDVYKIPSLNFLERCVEVIDRNTYSFDVAVTKDERECLIEIHDIFSLGFYGFEDYSIIPQMFIRGFENALKNTKDYE